MATFDKTETCSRNAKAEIATAELSTTLRANPLKLSDAEVGAQVIINYNPHHSGAEGIPGTIDSIHPGKGFAGCDLIYVAYEHPSSGEIHTMPFSLEKLTAGDSAILTACAERHEAIAAEFRRLAAQHSR